MTFAPQFNAMAAQIESLSNSIRPSLATVVTTAGAVGNLAVWQEAIKGWAAFATVLISVPTAIVVLVYWLFKLRREWLDRNK